MKTIRCTTGIAFVDDQDYLRVSQRSWSGNRYPQAKVRGKMVMMHHFILGKPPEGCVTDHIDRNKFNNQRSNLRFVSRNVNNRNVATRNEYRGVSKVQGGKFKASITVNGRVLHLGTFADKIDAAKAYDKAAILMHGDSAVLNFSHNETYKQAA